MYSIPLVYRNLPAPIPTWGKYVVPSGCRGPMVVAVDGAIRRLSWSMLFNLPPSPILYNTSIGCREYPCQ